MKSYNRLFEKLVNEENIRRAISNAAKGKNKKRRRHQMLKYIAQHSELYINDVRDWIANYKPGYHKVKVINDGISAKKRTITVPTAQEEIIHHAVVNVFKDIALPPMYEHSYASIPGRGIHSAAKRIKSWLRRDRTGTKYCLKLDIRKYFESVDQNVLLAKLRKLIRDDEFYNLLDKIVRSVDSGIPLGFVTSQWFANFYLTELDHKIKEEWQAKYYIRFMDDIVIFGSNKRKLHRLLENIRSHLENTLKLSVKDNWQIFYMDSDKGFKKGRMLDFLGFRFYRNHMGLRRKIALKMQRKAKHIAKKERCNIHDARQMVTYAGYTRYADVYNWYQSHIAPYVSIRQLRKQISYYDRRCANVSSKLCPCG